jgi:putative phosphotransacetylase
MAEAIASEIISAIRRKTGAAAAAPARSPVLPLGVSNRHIHLRKETFERLFGPGSKLEVFRQLYQPGEFASASVCMVVGPRMQPLTGVRILGPFRNYDQVELSLTDAIGIGIKPPVRQSGDIRGSAGVTLVGPAGTVNLAEGAILAARHVHLTSLEAGAFGVRDGDRIRVRTKGDRPTVLENVLVRVNDAWRLQLHLDTDEANAAGAVCGAEIEFAGRM